jgi:hypothetical protein
MRIGGNFRKGEEWDLEAIKSSNDFAAANLAKQPETDRQIIEEFTQLLEELSK